MQTLNFQDQGSVLISAVQARSTETLYKPLFIRQVYGSVLTADINTTTDPKSFLPLMHFYFLICVSFFFFSLHLYSHVHLSYQLIKSVF